MEQHTIDQHTGTGNLRLGLTNATNTANQLSWLALMLRPAVDYPLEAQFTLWREQRLLFQELQNLDQEVDPLTAVRCAFKEGRFSNLRPSPWSQNGSVGTLPIPYADYAVTEFCTHIIGNTYKATAAEITSLVRRKIRDRIGHEFLILSATCETHGDLWVRIDRGRDLTRVLRQGGGLSGEAPANDVVWIMIRTHYSP